MRISEIIALTDGYIGGSDTARGSLEAEYTEESVADYLAEASLIDNSIKADEEGITSEQIREWERRVGIAASTMLVPLVEFGESVSDWKHQKPHYRYECDGGNVALEVNGVRVLVNNGYGDGNFPVYVIDRRLPAMTEKETSQPFECSGVEFGECSLAILDYDCGDANVLVEFKVKSFMVATDGTGAVAIVVVK